jgi:nucleoside-diphosphate-sugar epimerase
MLTNHAVNKGNITVFGGNQMRPNLHVEDMVDAYHVMLTAPAEKIHGETFNIGFSESLDRRNRQSGEKGGRRGDAGEGEIKIVTTPTNDMRSYRRRQGDFVVGNDNGKIISLVMGGADGVLGERKSWLSNAILGRISA